MRICHSRYTQSIQCFFLKYGQRGKANSPEKDGEGRGGGEGGKGGEDKLPRCAKQLIKQLLAHFSREENASTLSLLP